MTTIQESDNRRRLPSVNRLLGDPSVIAAAETHGRGVVVDAVRAALEAARARIAEGSEIPDLRTLVADALHRATLAVSDTLIPVINATGVIIHTNLGRAPLSRAAREAMESVARGYSNLEFDLAKGERGSRYVHAEALLCKLTGAEAALVVNNNAGAVFLVLSVLAREREVIISRGQLVEIGGGFRIPDVLRQSGARLVEVGTTNRTHGHDFAEAIRAETALLLRVHSSNFRQIGFTTEVPLTEMADLAHAGGVLLVDDLGSGTLLDTARYGLAREPLVQESVTAGADLVTFSGDKLLGGPQAGLIVGRSELVTQLRRHPLTRALRVDKSTLAALQATLLHYLRGEAESEIPVWQMISAAPEVLADRAGKLAGALCNAGIQARVLSVTSPVGGGSLPGEALAGTGVAIAASAGAPDEVARRLRKSKPAVVARILDDELLIDVRTVRSEEDDLLRQALIQVYTQGRPIEWRESANDA